MLFLHKFGPLSAATRLRSYQYLPWLESRGCRCSFQALLPDVYLDKTYRARSKARALAALSPLIVSSYLRRAWTVRRDVPRYDVVYLQYEAMPYMPWACESSLFRSLSRVVLDLDDAIFAGYMHHSRAAVRTLLGAKLPRLAAACGRVIVANRYLAEWAGQYTSEVTLIPNALDLDHYAPATKARPNERPVIGWIGSPSTARFLRELEAPLRNLRRRHDFVLKVIGAPGFTMPGVEVVSVPWSEVTEVDELRACDIGVMPLPDNPWTRGKSALKLIQYLALGLPAVASPVGANTDVITHGVNGLLARTDDEWTDTLSLLIAEPAERVRLGAAGRVSAEEAHSLQAMAPRFVDALCSVAAG